MAFPNLVSLVLLSPVVAKVTKDYFARRGAAGRGVLAGQCRRARGADVQPGDERARRCAGERGCASTSAPWSATGDR